MSLAIALLFCCCTVTAAAGADQVDWLTPVEVFAPWYGRALAHYMLELRKHDSSIDTNIPLNIVEVGGGTGTLAASILVRLVLHHILYWTAPY